MLVNYYRVPSVATLFTLGVWLLLGLGDAGGDVTRWFAMLWQGNNIGLLLGLLLGLALFWGLELLARGGIDADEVLKN